MSDPVSDPTPRSVEGPSFLPVHKALATLMVLALLGFAGHALLQPEAAKLDFGLQAALLCGLGLVLASYWAILKSRTRIDGHSIRQEWLWTKEVKLAEITQLKLVHLPALSWLIAPRLIVRTGGLSRTVFPAADPEVIGAFRQLALGPGGARQSAPPP